MVETLQRNGLWHRDLIIMDLIKQANFKEADFKPEFGPGFSYKGRIAVISHIYNKELVVSIGGDEDNDLREIMEGFSKIVEYKPFCKYVLNLDGHLDKPLVTYEWDKFNPNGRYFELDRKTNVFNLMRILSEH